MANVFNLGVGKLSFQGSHSLRDSLMGANASGVCGGGALSKFGGDGSL